ncbi:MAG TPA: LLM class flavin-dependent oxidoreductase [Solirubrobacterales bacterium]|jgi:alkanesulfonate monooxygenase SsuD/methylene tetrahydromethanopterin reductase-like flavin-dependent oxidoreductase (luciferase family)
MDLKFYLMFNPYTWESADAPVRLAGQRTDLYQNMLEELLAHAQIADRCGFEGIFFSEQHGNIEGIPEVTSNPMLLDLFVAANTERIKVGTLGVTLPVANPLLVADQIAQIDQLTKGRMMAGFARGNTTRWADQYGQHIPMGSTRSDKSEADERNLRALMEAWEIIKLAWTETTFSFDGEFWKFPVPGTKWVYPHTKEWGTAVDDDQNLLGVGIAPRPYQTPHPRIFAPMSGRAATVQYWAREGASIMCLTPREDLIAGMLDVYAQEVEKSGRTPRRGEGIVAGGTFSIASDAATARARAEKMEAWDSMVYGVPPYNLPHPMALNGTPEEIIEQVAGLHERLGIEEFLFIDEFPAPHGREVAREMLELLGTEVLPALRSSTVGSDKAAAVAGD